jgi:predicted Zn-dependent protease with MMP-like domain
MRSATDRVDELLASATERWEADGAEAALPLLLEALSLDGDDADVRYALGTLYEQLGDREQMVRHFVQTRLLDARDDREAGLGSAAELDFIERVATEAIDGLPAELRERVDRGVSIMLAARPPMQMVREGFDPRAFGVFEGPGLLDEDEVAPLPPHILLFTSNLIAEFSDRETLAQQVAVTVLHEVAHFFGYEEDEMDALGLE